MKTATYDESKYRLVPIYATDEMLAAGVDNGDWGYHESSLTQRSDSNGTLPDIWAAMLEAAPQPAVEESLKVLEAVAWRWRSDVQVQYNKPWNLTQDAEFVALMLSAGGHVVEPLAHPQRDAADAARYRFLRMSATISWNDWVTYECLTTNEQDRLDMDANIDHQIAKINAAMSAGRGEVGL